MTIMVYAMNQGPEEIRSLDSLEWYKCDIVSFECASLKNDNFFKLNNKFFGYIHGSSKMIEGEEKLTFSILCEDDYKSNVCIRPIMLSNEFLKKAPLVIERATKSEIKTIQAKFKTPMFSFLGYQNDSRSYLDMEVTPAYLPSSKDSEKTGLLKNRQKYHSYRGHNDDSVKDVEQPDSESKKNSTLCFLM